MRGKFAVALIAARSVAGQTGALSAADTLLAFVADPRQARGSLSTPTYADRMPVSDVDIARSAHQWISLHGENAMARAREMVETMRKKGDTEGADTWLRVIAAITTGARH
jgi:hypothetical protein